MIICQLRLLVLFVMFVGGYEISPLFPILALLVLAISIHLGYKKDGWDKPNE